MRPLILFALALAACGPEVEDPPDPTDAGVCLAPESFPEPCSTPHQQNLCFGLCNAELDGAYGFNSVFGCIQCVCCDGECTRHTYASVEDGEGACPQGP